MTAGQEILEKKQKAEQDIANIIRDFTKESGATITSIDITTTSTFNGAANYTLTLKVEL